MPFHKTKPCRIIKESPGGFMKNIPNILSMLRILLIPFFVRSLIVNNPQTAGLILLASGLTDVLDGFLARTFNWQSQLGALLDPLADKLTQATVAFSFMFYFKDYQYILLILVTKDVLMIASSLYAYRNKLPISQAKWYGKAATLIFYLTTILLLLVPTLPHSIKLTLLLSCAILALYASAMYIYVFIRKVKTV